MKCYNNYKLTVIIVIKILHNNGKCLNRNETSKQSSWVIEFRRFVQRSFIISLAFRYNCYPQGVKDRNLAVLHFYLVDNIVIYYAEAWVKYTHFFLKKSIKK